ncbi:MAG: DUF2851 family protein [Bacteroidales bacterium]|nr:DUF2851 family protein [Bacteroidales bacterium]
MKEEFLYYLWENRLISGELKSVDDQRIWVVNPGYRNFDSGPDYLEARIEIGGQLWAGHVEIHVRTSDWNRHGHQHDKAYNNVVLHVVYEHDTPVNDIPILSLKGHFDERLFLTYQQFVNAQRWIACERNISSVQPFSLHAWIERMAVERIEGKSATVSKMLQTSHYDWEDTLYHLVLRYLGMKVNNEAFETLAALLPFKILLKHADHLTQLEAMLLGCAGFLKADCHENYPLLLRQEFAAMQSKFNLVCMPVERWKLLRMRPSNFPTLRLAQMAQLIHKNGTLFSKIRAAQTIAEVKDLFDVAASEYWETHYRLGFETELKTKHLGDATADVLIINAVVPLLFCYGKLHKDESVCETALQFLEDIEAEDNAIIRHFKQCGITADNAMQTQAMLHLYNMYCKRKRCLECRIGNVLLTNST